MPGRAAMHAVMPTDVVLVSTEPAVKPAGLGRSGHGDRSRGERADGERRNDDRGFDAHPCSPCLKALIIQVECALVAMSRRPVHAIRLADPSMRAADATLAPP